MKEQTAQIGGRRQFAERGDIAGSWHAYEAARQNISARFCEWGKGCPSGPSVHGWDDGNGGLVGSTLRDKDGGNGNSTNCGSYQRLATIVYVVHDCADY